MPYMLVCSRVNFINDYGKSRSGDWMTKMLNVNIETAGVDQNEAKEWVNEMANVYADMEIEDVNVSGNKISFKAGFSGMDDTDPDDVKMKIEEYLTMNEAFQAKNVSIK
jgi:hypothetical protein